MFLEIKFNRSRIILGVLFSLIMLFFSICFIIYPEVFIRNIFMKIYHIQILGMIGILYFSVIFYSTFRLYNRKFAIQITKDFLIDNSRYESLGEIKWSNISKIKRIKKYSIEIFLNESVFHDKKFNVLEKFLLFMGNWNYKKSIIISSALTDSNIDELFENITSAFLLYKRKVYE